MGTIEQSQGKRKNEAYWAVYNTMYEKLYVEYLIMQIETLQEYDLKIPQCTLED